MFFPGQPDRWAGTVRAAIESNNYSTPPSDLVTVPNFIFQFQILTEVSKSQSVRFDIVADVDAFGNPNVVATNVRPA